MMSKYLIVVDMQNDFISGTLGTEEAKDIVGRVKDKIAGAVGNSNIIFTMDTHTGDYLDTMEGQILPVMHCISETEGWQIAPGLLEILQSKGVKPDIIQKPTFGSVELAAGLKEIDKRSKIEEIELVGLCTDICVISNALLLKAFFPEAKIKVDASCCAGVTQASHNNALESMKMCHIEIV